MIGNVFVGNRRAATLRREGAHTVFTYETDYLDGNNDSVATTLPLSPEPVHTPGASVPAFFAGLLPEGRRLNALVRNAKTSADDELGLLLAVGPATVGDVYVIEGSLPVQEKPTVQIPRNPEQLDFSEVFASQGIALSPRIAGVQDKASAQMISFHASKADVEYLIKFDPPEFRHLCRNEQFFLERAKKLKIDVGQSRLITDSTGVEALLAKRFDRNKKELIHVEDGTQVLGHYPADKYNLSFEEVAQGLSRATISPLASSINLLTQLAFAWLTGNGDMHAKNLSIVGRKQASLVAPMYDLPSSLFYPDLNPELALKVGDHSTLTVKRFIEVGQFLGLPLASVENIRRRVLAVTEEIADEVDNGVLPFDPKITSKAARQLRRRYQEFSKYF
ncbi:MAG: HipA domain-containing protein [Aurantimicrobium sp.]